MSDDTAETRIGAVIHNALAEVEATREKTRSELSAAYRSGAEDMRERIIEAAVENQLAEGCLVGPLVDASNDIPIPGVPDE